MGLFGKGSLVFIGGGLLVAGVLLKTGLIQWLLDLMGWFLIIVGIVVVVVGLITGGKGRSRDY